MPKVENLLKTAAEWAESNPVLGAGQTGVEKFTKKSKTGDGLTTWNSLSYNLRIVDVPDLELSGGSDGPAQVHVVTDMEEVVPENVLAFLTGEGAFLLVGDGVSTAMELSVNGANLFPDRLIIDYLISQGSGGGGGGGSQNPVVLDESTYGGTWNPETEEYENAVVLGLGVLGILPSEEGGILYIGNGVSTVTDLTSDMMFLPLSFLYGTLREYLFPKLQYGRCQYPSTLTAHFNDTPIDPASGNYKPNSIDRQDPLSNNPLQTANLSGWLGDPSLEEVISVGLMQSGLYSVEVSYEDVFTNLEDLPEGTVINVDHIISRISNSGASVSSPVTITAESIAYDASGPLSPVVLPTTMFALLGQDFEAVENSGAVSNLVFNVYVYPALTDGTQVDPADITALGITLNAVTKVRLRQLTNDTVYTGNN